MTNATLINGKAKPVNEGRAQHSGPRTNQHSISLLVTNKPGVLIRIALVFSRRGYNIDSLVVSPTHNGKFARMNIVASGEPKTLIQIIHQLNKLIDVIHAKDHTGETVVEKELALIKVRCAPERRTAPRRAAAHRHCRSAVVSRLHRRHRRLPGGPETALV